MYPYMYFICLLLITSSRTISIMAVKKSEYLIYCDLSHFTMLILHCVENNLQNFSCILRKSVMHVTNNQFL